MGIRCNIFEHAHRSSLFGQLLVGLINGAFYAMLSLGLAIIFGMLNVINFTHGAQYMMGAFVAWLLLDLASASATGGALILAPLVVGLFGIVIERLLLQAHLPPRPSLRLPADLRHGADHRGRCSSGTGARRARRIRARSPGGYNLGFMFLPAYRGFVVIAALVICLVTWYAIERTKLGAYLRAATENPTLVRAFGINVPRLITLTYGLGVGLAGVWRA